MGASVLFCTGKCWLLLSSTVTYFDNLDQLARRTRFDSPLWDVFVTALGQISFGGKSSLYRQAISNVPELCCAG